MTVTLKCEIDANPWSQPNWIKDTTQSNISIADMESVLRTDEEGSFTIISAKVSDSGWYRCVTDQADFGHFASFGYFLNVRCKSKGITSLHFHLSDRQPVIPSAFLLLLEFCDGKEGKNMKVFVFP
jgi:hypothetical protein